MTELQFIRLNSHPLPQPPVSDRPKCKHCGKPKGVELIREELPLEERRKGKRGKPLAWAYMNRFEGFFCTQKCATIWANKYFDLNP